ncbi:MAG TPA: LCP family protein [Candidatus Saccharimonadales bacterium]|nr:LCP family protein [Candidatus Saccharimonadales bacterium]
MNKKRASLDGFVSSGRRLGTPSSYSYQPNRETPTPTLESMHRRPDGFHAIQQPSFGAAHAGVTAGNLARAEDEAVLDEPIVLDDIDEPKRKDKARGKAKRARLRKNLKRALLLFLAFIIAAGAFMGYKFYSTQRQVLSGGGRSPSVCDGNVPVSALHKEGDGRVNILLLGIGSEGILTDTIMIASLDPFNDKVDLLSVPRDLWVNIPVNGQEKINAAYSFGIKNSKGKSEFEKKRDGVKLLDTVLQNVTGVDIHYHAVFDFTAFKQIVDNLGGVTVNVPETLYDPTIAWENHYNPVIATKGVQQFDGARALLYAKSRETSSDFARNERQRLLLAAIKDKAFSLGTFSNPVKVVSLMNSLGRNVYTDFDTQSIKCLYTQISEVQSSNIKSLDLVTPPHNLVTTGPYLGRSIVRPVAGFFDYSQIRDYVRKTFRDGLLAKENAPVAVYNATTTAGLATKTGDTLKIYGYNVTTVENSTNQTNPPNTVVVDLSHGANKYTRNYLERRFGVSAVNGIPSGLGINPPQGTAFVIIVGTDENTGT